MGGRRGDRHETTVGQLGLGVELRACPPTWPTRSHDRSASVGLMPLLAPPRARDTCLNRAVLRPSAPLTSSTQPDQQRQSEPERARLRGRRARRITHGPVGAAFEPLDPSAVDGGSLGRSPFEARSKVGCEIATGELDLWPPMRLVDGAAVPAASYRLLAHGEGRAAGQE